MMEKYQVLGQYLWALILRAFKILIGFTFIYYLFFFPNKPIWQTWGRHFPSNKGNNFVIVCLENFLWSLNIKSSVSSILFLPQDSWELPGGKCAAKVCLFLGSFIPRGILDKAATIFFSCYLAYSGSFLSSNHVSYCYRNANIFFLNTYVQFPRGLKLIMTNSHTNLESSSWSHWIIFLTLPIQATSLSIFNQLRVNIGAGCPYLIPAPSMFAKSTLQI